MTFLFDCTDEVCLPKAYYLVDDIKAFVEKVKDIDVDAEKADKKTVLKKVLENAMTKYPKETGELFAKLWVLDKGEKAPNAFKTMATLFSNEVAIDFFTSVLPSLLQISSQVSPMLK